MHLRDISEMIFDTFGSCSEAYKNFSEEQKKITKEDFISHV